MEAEASGIANPNDPTKRVCQHKARVTPRLAEVAGQFQGLPLADPRWG